MLMYITMIHYDSLQKFPPPDDTNQFRIQKKYNILRTPDRPKTDMAPPPSDQAGWRREEEMITAPKKNTLEYVASALSDPAPYTLYSVYYTYYVKHP